MGHHFESAGVRKFFAVPVVLEVCLRWKGPELPPASPFHRLPHRQRIFLEHSKDGCTSNIGTKTAR